MPKYQARLKAMQGNPLPDSPPPQDRVLPPPGNTIPHRENLAAQLRAAAGNPEGATLSEALSAMAEFVEYEANVVEVAAEEIEDDAVQEEAEQQADAMHEAADALQEASEAASETAAEVFNETDTPRDQQTDEVVSGNPTRDTSELDAAIVAFREDPSDENRDRLLRIQAEYTRDFYRRTSAEYIAQQGNPVEPGPAGGVPAQQDLPPRPLSWYKRPIFSRQAHTGIE